MQATASESAGRADRLLASGRLGEDDARRFAEALVLRHARARRAPEAFPDAAALVCDWHDALACLVRNAPSLDTPQLRDLGRQQAELLEAHADHFLARAGANRILERAVALRLGDVMLGSAGEARITVDGASHRGRPGDACVELAGLSVDLRAADLTGPAERLVSHYAGEADDFELYEIFDCLECACALKRAAQEAERGAGAIDADARDEAQHRAFRLVSLAQATRRRSLLPPLVVVMGGGVAVGKSTLARTLAQNMSAPRVVADRVRSQLIEGVPGREVHEAHGWQGLEPGLHERVYAEVLRRAELALRSGRAVVLDACFSRRRDRAAARALARRHDVSFRFVECRIADPTQRARLAQRERELGQRGWLEIARTFVASSEPVNELSEDEHLVLDTSRPSGESAVQLAPHLPAWPDGVPG